MLWRILFTPGVPFLYRVIFLAWEVAIHWAATWILAISFFLLAIMAGAPVIFVWDNGSLGAELRQSIEYVQHMHEFNTWEAFLSFNWYFRLSFMVGCFFPFAHFFLGWGLKPLGNFGEE